MEVWVRNCQEMRSLGICDFVLVWGVFVLRFKIFCQVKIRIKVNFLKWYINFINFLNIKGLRSYDIGWGKKLCGREEFGDLWFCFFLKDFLFLELGFLIFCQVKIRNEVNFFKWYIIFIIFHNIKGLRS